jgi:hypothetical protein
VLDAGGWVLSPAYWASTLHVPEASGGPDALPSESLKVPPASVVGVSTVGDAGDGGW